MRIDDAIEPMQKCGVTRMEIRVQTAAAWLGEAYRWPQRKEENDYKKSKYNFHNAVFSLI
jgi:hypothetical protein